MNRLRLRGRTWRSGEFAIMAIVNRTPDSFYDKGVTFAFDQALERVARVVEQGADIIDIGRVKAAPGDEVSVDEELERTGDFVAAVRAGFSDVIINVDTWRHEVGEAVCRVGADLPDHAWGGADPKLAEVAATHGVGLVCRHLGAATPRTRPHRVGYPDVVTDAVATTSALAERAAHLRVARESIVIDPAHDLGNTTYHSLQLTRDLDRMVDTGWPVLVSLSNKDFVGDALAGLPTGERLIGTLAATAICAWHRANVYRAHNVVETWQALDMVASIKGDRLPARAVRGLA